MQSKDYVPGVSGWKLHADTGFLEVNGVMRMGGLLGADVKAPELGPFIIVDGVTYVRQAEVDAGPIKSIRTVAKQSAMDGFKRAKEDLELASAYSVKLSRSENGQYVFAGIGLGIPVRADQDAFELPQCDASKLLDDLAAAISNTQLVSEFNEQIEKCCDDERLAAMVRKVICNELRAGGLLHRR